MEVEYHLTMEDYVSFNLYHYNRSPTIRRYWHKVQVLFLIIVILSAVIAFLDPVDCSALAIVVGIIVLIAVLVSSAPSLRAHLAKANVARMLGEGHNRTLLGWHRISIGPEGIAHSGEHSAATVKWSGVERIADSDEFVFIYISAVSGYLVPSRAFGGEEHFREFVSRANEFLREAQPRPEGSSAPSGGSSG